MKAIVVGRHSFLPAQEAALSKIGIEVVAQVPHVESVDQLIQRAKEVGADAIVVQALPLFMMVQLLQKKGNLKVYMIKMRPVALAETKEEAEKLVAENPAARVALPSPRGPWRVMEFDGITEVKEVRIVEEYVVKYRR